MHPGGSAYLRLGESASTGIDLSEWALLLGAIGGAVLALAVAWRLIQRRETDKFRAHVDSRFGSLEVSLEQVATAVNHVSDGEPTLIQRVRMMEDHAQWEVEVLTIVLRNLGIERIPPRPQTWRTEQRTADSRTRKDDQA